MPKQFSTERKIIAAFAGAFAVLLITSLVSVHYIRSLLRNWDQVSHSHKVLDGIAELQRNMFMLPERARNFSGHPDPVTYREFQQQCDEVRSCYQNLLVLTADNAVQQKNLQEFDQRFEAIVGSLKPDSEPTQVNAVWSNSPLRPSYQFVIYTIDEEHRLLDGRDRATRQTSAVALITIAAAGLLAAIIIVAFAVMVIRDLKQRQRNEIELQRARMAAEAANVAKSSFLANISHELRTPLTAILGYTDLLMSPSSTPQDHNRCLATMRRSGEHLLNIINDVLDLSKIEAGRMEVERIDCRLLEVLADVDSLMRPRASMKGVEFVVAYGSAVPERVMTDPTRLRQVLVNLVSNAVKFTEEGHVRVTITHDKNNGGEKVVIDVVDSGIGIPMDKQEALFQPFTQADVTTTRRYGGTGLGLSISRRLAEMMGGTLTCTSEPGKGSVFRLSMPVTSPEGTAMLAPGEMQRMLAAAKGPAGELRRVAARVLLAEDGPEAREVIALHLERAGCVVSTVVDGLSAVEHATRAAEAGTPYDVILMDIQMPVMDGYTATAKLRSQGYKGTIVALTANAMKEDRERCMRAGCDEYLSKPVDVPTLLKTIDKFAKKGAVGAPVVPAEMLADPVLRQLTQKFCDGVPASLDGMRQRLEGNEVKELAAAAHKLAGAGGSYGFREISDAAKALERLAKNGADSAALREQLERLTVTCEAARSAVATETA